MRDKCPPTIIRILKQYSNRQTFQFELHVNGGGLGVGNRDGLRSRISVSKGEEALENCVLM